MANPLLSPFVRRVLHKTWNFPQLFRYSMVQSELQSELEDSVLVWRRALRVLEYACDKFTQTITNFETLISYLGPLWEMFCQQPTFEKEGSFRLGHRLGSTQFSCSSVILNNLVYFVFAGLS